MQYHYHIHIEGLVQGVGFRPFVYRIALENGMHGRVDNRNDGVHIVMDSTPEEKKQFLNALLEESPPQVQIEKIRIERTENIGKYTDFQIAPSRSFAQSITRISPDIAVCDACLEDMKRQPHRKSYPFVNCTHCGPRFSIVKQLPYDRAATTMNEFPLCACCRAEFSQITDRRFHAQPIACNACGPHYTLYRHEFPVPEDYDGIVSRLIEALRRGGVIALKDVGGYHLVARADSEEAVARIRSIKQREYKPFALLTASVDTARRFAEVSEQEAQWLSSWRRPIVLLKERTTWAPGINDGLSRVGVLLPSLPIHVHLCEAMLGVPLVFTSANQNGVPLITEHQEAMKVMGDSVDYLLSHNRPIYNRVDDSVMQWVGGGAQLLRRARGFTPEPIVLEQLQTEGVLAFGAEQNGAFALGKENQIIQSQYLGSTTNCQTEAFFKEALSHFSDLFRFKPSFLACDMHPLYHTSQWACALANAQKIPLMRIQHHHAHALAVMAEYQLQKPLLAVVLDGAGYGTDGTVWGGEFLRCEGYSFERLAHLPYVPLPGGDAAAKEPWRMAVAYLHTLFGANTPHLEFYKETMGRERVELLQKLIERRVQAPFTSSCGRLFDAVASLLGICHYNSYQGEAPMRLEQCADLQGSEPYPIDRYRPLSLQPLLQHLLDEQAQGVPRSLLSARFHNTLSQMLFLQIKQLLIEQNLTQVVLCGGVFQNRLLTEGIVLRLQEAAIPYFLQRQSPCNDASIAVGQLYGVALRQNRKTK